MTEKATERVTILLTPSDLAAVNEHIAEMRRNRSDWIREALMAHMGRSIAAPDVVADAPVEDEPEHPGLVPGSAPAGFYIRKPKEPLAVVSAPFVHQLVAPVIEREQRFAIWEHEVMKLMFTDRGLVPYEYATTEILLAMGQMGFANEVKRAGRARGKPDRLYWRPDLMP